MSFQYDYLGGSVPQNTGFLKCPKCLDDLNFQRKLIIIPPDPPPLFNTRPEPYTVDETSWLTTEDGDTITTQDGEDLISNQPNPADVGGTTHLTTEIPLDPMPPQNTLDE